MKKNWRYTLLAVFLCLLLLGGVTINSINNIQLHGKLINYAGIVRGATQRLIKMELNDIPSDDILNQVDDIILNLVNGKGEYDLPKLNDEKYQKALSKQFEQWESLKKLIYEYREDHSLNQLLLTESEVYFESADNTVFAAEKYSDTHTQKLLYLIVAMFFSVIALCLFIFMTNFKKIVRLESFNRTLKDKAGRDSLTGVYSLKRFEMIAQELLDTHEFKFALFYLDFSDFKYINDVFGYTVGDDLLHNYARIMKEDNDCYEIVGRVSADNFVALRHYQNKQELVDRQKRINAKITEYMRSKLNKQALSVYCGICCLEDVDRKLRVDELITRSNFARKTIKKGEAPIHYRFYDESIRQQLFEEKAIESSIGDAFSNQEFVVYYQPKVNADTKEVAGAEALVRWQKEDGTMLMPDSFIPVFEKNHTIAHLDQYVFEKVCCWMQSMLENDIKMVPISINVSRLQFYDIDFISIYTSIKQKYQIPNNLLEIEFTESIMFENWKQLIEIVDKLHVAGFRCSIDDFGKGYSSLSMLKNLDIDVLKIDAMFFRDLNTSNKDRMLVKSIVQLAQLFDIETVAEGIENMEQVAFLKDIHCDLIQGYAYYQPISQTAFSKVLKNIHHE